MSESGWTEGEEAPPGASKPSVGQDYVDAFPSGWKDDFEGLALLGYLQDTVRIPFHSFVVRTVLPADKLQVALLCREYDGTFGFNKAYTAAIAAAGLVTVDGQPLIVASRKDSAVLQKYLYLVNTWYEPIHQLLYAKINELEARQIEIMVALGVLPKSEE